MKVLQIIQTAYRATTEEQDDTVVWITHAMRGAGAELAILLCGSAVSYVAADQDASGLQLGTWRQTQPPRIAADLAALAGKAVAVYCLKEDLEERGLREAALPPGMNVVARAQVARLFGEFDQVWRW
jgi:sulfur relay (sulfurtransferase) DsrF/TusC family protein